MSVVLQTGVMYYRESQSDDWHPLILKVDTDLSALIEDYSQRAWALGEYCRYDSAIYRCTTAITTPEVWDSTHWQETTIGDELKVLNDEIIISDTQPTEQNNKLWVKETSSGDGVSIPTMGDIDDIEDEISAVETALNQLDSDKTDKTDLTNIIQTGTTCTVSGGISKGTFFYLNGTLVVAKEAIAENAPYTSGTNYEAVTAGGLNALKSGLTGVITTQWKFVSSLTVPGNGVADATITTTKSGWIFIGVLGWIINSGNACTMVHMRVKDANTVIIRLRNNSSSSHTTDSIQALCLYIKDGSGLLA